jgi:hypothetical protein
LSLAEAAEALAMAEEEELEASLLLEMNLFLLLQEQLIKLQ